jgi:protein TonB
MKIIGEAAHRRAVRFGGKRRQWDDMMKTTSRLSLIGCALAFAAGVARAETYEISQLDQKPVPVSQVRPVYPPDLRKTHTPGKVVVDFFVDTTGEVVQATAASATNDEFAQSALAAVSHWKFHPGLVGGNPVVTHLQVPIMFALRQQP